MKKNYIKVKDHKNLYRDSSTNSIVNADSNEYLIQKELLEIKKNLKDILNGLNNS